MRRKDREITDFNEMLEVIKAADAGHLAFNAANEGSGDFEDGFPYVIPINFGEKIVDGKVVIYFHGTPEYGKKYDLLAKDDRVCFCVDTGHKLRADLEKMSYTMGFESVIMYGRLSICGEAEKMDALQVIIDHYKIEGGINEKSAAVTRCFKLTVEKMTGKRRKLT